MAAETRFAMTSRVLHWLMAVMILTMLFVGIAMVATVGPTYHRLVDLHRPLGIAILVLAILRLVNRFVFKVPALPRDLPAVMRFAAQGSHALLYGLMIALPLVGWGMLSAGEYPVAMGGGLTLPPVLPHSTALFAALRSLHTWLAFALFAVVLAHIGAALLHGLILRDGVFQSMAGGRSPAEERPL